MLHDWQRGKIPYFVAPPFEDEEDESSKTPAKKKKRTEEPENAEAPSGPQLGTILQDIPQNFTKIAVKQQFNEEDNVVPDYMEESELDQTTGKKNATDWDDVLGESSSPSSPSSPSRSRSRSSSPSSPSSPSRSRSRSS